MKLSRSIFFATALSSIAAFASEEVVRLTPPELTQDTILKELHCTRPMREGKFQISAEEREGKVLVHCYGHGGSGWTTLFGSVERAIELFEEKKVDKATPIRVIGSGCMGLTSAIELKRKGYNVVGIFTKELFEIPSWKAAGYFALVSIKTSPEEEANLKKIGINTFKAYQQIDQGTHPYISKDAVRYMPVYCSDKTESGVEDLEAEGLIPPRKLVTLDFGGGAVHPHFVEYMTYFMDTSLLMKYLNAEVKRLKIPVEMHPVASFDEVEESVVFNCSGLGGRELNADDQMIAVRGHLLLLNEKAGTEHMNYMIYTKVEQDGEERYIYMFPKTLQISQNCLEGESCKAVLGGTFIPHTDRLSKEELEKLDRVEFKKCLDRNLIFFKGSL
jgi:D-amino-acid oxidase